MDRDRRRVPLRGRRSCSPPSATSRRSGGCAARSWCCSAAARPTSSTSPSRCRAGSTTSTARSTRSRPALARVDRRVDESVSKTAIVRYDAYEGTRRPPVGVVRDARLGPQRHRRDRDPGPRLRAHLREGARPRAERRSPSRRRSRRPSSGRWRPGEVAVRSARYFSGHWVQHVLVLNASYEPLNVCTVRRAHVLVFKGKAEVHRAASTSRSAPPPAASSGRT